MTIRLNGQTSGYVELEAPATAGSNTLVLPTNNGSSGDYLQTDGSGTLSWQTVDTNDQYVWSTTAGSAVTSIEFTLPTNARVVWLAYHDCDPGTYTGNEDNRVIMQFATGSTPTYKTSGYTLFSGNNGGTINFATNNYQGISAYLWLTNSHENGQFICTRAGANTWSFTGSTTMTDPGSYVTQSSGAFDLSGTPTRVRFTTRGGTLNLASGDFSVGYLTDD